MIPWLTAALYAGATVLALTAGFLTWRSKPVGDALLAVVACVEVLLVIQLVVGIVQVIGTERDVNPAVWVAYLVGMVVVPPVASLWALEERSRWGTGVLVVTGLTLLVLTGRLQQLWGGTGA